MVDDVARALATAPPEMRERYLRRIRTASDPYARTLEDLVRRMLDRKVEGVRRAS